jgi:hypothetical protein
MIRKSRSSRAARSPSRPAPDTSAAGADSDDDESINDDGDRTQTMPVIDMPFEAAPNRYPSQINSAEHNSDDA